MSASRTAIELSPNRLLAVAAISLVALSGCASTSPGYDSRFGDAARQLRAQQLLDPAAPTRNQGVPVTIDGRTVYENNERYLESSKAPPVPTVVNIGVGSGSSR